MSVFKVGQRVRVVGATFHPENIGREAVITRDLWLDPNLPPSHMGRLVYGIDIIGHPHPIYGEWAVLPEHIRPLTDPGADAFIERIKKLGREPINLAEKVTR